MAGTYTGITSEGIIGEIVRRLDVNAALPWVNALTMKFNSTQDIETYKWLGTVPQLREWIGERQAKQLREQGYTLANKLWESTIEVDVDDMRLDKTGQLDLAINSLVQRAQTHPWDQVVNLIENGGASLCYDGQYFFDTDHSEGESGTQINELAAAQVTELNVASATAPTQLEASKAIMGVIEYMTNYLDDQGEPLNENAAQFLVVCRPSLAASFRAALTSQVVIDASGVSTSNIIPGSGFNIQLASTVRITDTDGFYVFRTDAPVKPFIWQEELPLEVSAIAEGSELEFKENKHQYGLKARYAFGYGLWQYAAHATLS